MASTALWYALRVPQTMPSFDCTGEATRTILQALILLLVRIPKTSFTGKTVCSLEPITSTFSWFTCKVIHHCYSPFCITLYSFIFTLQEFARELLSLVDAMERIYTFEQARLVQRSFWRKAFVRIAHTLHGIRHWGKSGKSSQGGSGLRRSLCTCC